MYVAVCDDQIEELELLAGLLRQWQEEHHAFLRFKTFQSATELLNAAKTEPFTLYLLDVIMAGTDGMAAAREIRNLDSAADIVFLTSSPSFAYASYGVHALDYLLKPVQPEMLFPILSQLSLREQKLQESLTIKCGPALVRIPFSRLTYVEVNRKHLYFCLNDGSVKEVFGTLYEYEPLLLSRPEFMRIHRSYIVNMLQVAELSPAGAITFSGKNLPVSRRLYSQLQKDYMKLLFSQSKE